MFNIENILMNDLLQIKYHLISSLSYFMHTKDWIWEKIHKYLSLEIEAQEKLKL